MTLNDLKPPKGVLVNFSQCLAAAHILKVNFDKVPKDRPRQPTYEIFNIKR